jgi:1-acyl-sn-glycerol-3-phosphate acyltransferase
VFALLYLVLPRRWHRVASRHLIHHSLRTYLAVLRIACQVRLDLDALQGLRRETQPLIVVANHPSLLDAVLLLSVLPNASCVLKASLLRNPLFGVGLDSVDALREGAQFILFPEGTRTARFPLDTLSSACILLAKQSRVPLQTVFLEYSTPYLGKHWGLLRPPELPLTVRARLGRRFDPPAFTGTALAELEQHFRQELVH